MIYNEITIYKINNLVRVRYKPNKNISGITDLKFIVTSPSGIESIPVYMTEIELGLYEATFIPDEIGYWFIRLSSVSEINELDTRMIFVGASYNRNQLEAIESNIYYFSDDSESSTTSTTFINKLSWEFTPIIFGEYIFNWSFEMADSLASGNYLYRVVYNSTILTSSRINTGVSYGNGGWFPISGFKKIGLLSSSENFSIDYCRSSGTAYIKNARFKLTRIN